MEFSSNINLTQRASIAVVSSFWNKDDIITDIKRIIIPNQVTKNWSEIENDVLRYLRNIILPDILKLNLENLVQPMGMQILKWISLTKSTFWAYSQLPEFIAFYWTGRGTLDYIRTTEYVISSVSDDTLRFHLACIFCVEKIIFELWTKVGQALRENAIKKPGAIEPIAVIYWMNYLNNDIENLMTLTEYCGVRNAQEFAFLLTLETKCTSTLGYFLEHVQPERKPKLAFLALQKIFRARRPHDGNVLIFLFSYLEEPDINQFIKENSYCVLASLLEWPCSEFFMSVAVSVWNHMSSVEYLNLFQDLIEYVSRYSASNVYKNLAKNFWLSSPSSFKEYIITKCTSGTFLSRLFLYDNTDEIIEKIFNDCSPNERRQMIFYFEGMNICDLLVKREKWNSLKLLITSCISSRDDLEEFIKQYETSKPCYCTKETSLRTDILIYKIREWF